VAAPAAGASRQRRRLKRRSRLPIVLWAGPGEHISSPQAHLAAPDRLVPRLVPGRPAARRLAVRHHWRGVDAEDVAEILRRELP
jgi:hypothetical protein